MQSKIQGFLKNAGKFSLHAKMPRKVPASGGKNGENGASCSGNSVPVMTLPRRPAPFLSDARGKKTPPFIGTAAVCGAI